MVFMRTTSRLSYQSNLTLGVSNLYGSRQSRDDEREVHRCMTVWFPIYMDPDRVGTAELSAWLDKKAPVSNLYGSRQSRDHLENV